MIKTRILTAVLAGVSVLSLAACSEEAPANSTKPAATTAAAAPAATTAATTEAAAPPAAAGLSDKEICEAVNKTVDSMKDAMSTIAQTTGGDISAADQKAILSDMAKQLDKAVVGSETEVAKAVKLISSQATEAAAAKDPTEALDNPESEKSGKALNAACKKAGVTTNF